MSCNAIDNKACGESDDVTMIFPNDVIISCTLAFVTSSRRFFSWNNFTRGISGAGLKK